MPARNAEAATSDREIIITRVFEAPRERVWRAWTDPKHVARWWGPKGFSTTIIEMDLRTGGVWRQVMRGPDGTEYPSESVFTEVVEPERICYSHGGGRKGAPGVHIDFTWTFEALDGEHTRLTIRQVYASAKDRDTMIKEYGAIEGGEQTLQRLADHIASTAEAAPELRMTRIFDAPRRLVFAAWTQSEHVAQWFTPRPLTTPQCEVDCRVGGVFRVVMRMPNGTDHHFDGKFVEVVPDERLVFTGKIQDGPDTMTTVTFTESESRTTLSVHQTYSFASDATRGATQGWTATLDQLGEFVAKR